MLVFEAYPNGVKMRRLQCFPAVLAVAMLMENADSTSEQGLQQADGTGAQQSTDQQLQALKAAIQLREDGQLEASLELIDAALAAGETDPWWLDNKVTKYWVNIQ